MPDKFTIVVPFWTGDRNRAERLLKWMKEIGGTHYPIMLMASHESDPEGLLPIAKECHPDSFIEYDYENIKTTWGASREPGRSARGPNSLFQQTARYFHDWSGKGNGRGDFLFLETDALPIPFEGGWDVELYRQYKTCGTPFFGARVPGGDAYPEHMSGVAVWPENTAVLSEGVMRCADAAFDVVGAQDVVPKATFTTSIVHQFWHPGFTSQEEVDRWIGPNTLIFHANKDGSLIPFLRERLISTSRETLHRLIKEDAGPKSFPVTVREDQLEDHLPSKQIAAGSTPVTHSPLNIVKTFYEKLEGRNHAEQEWLLATWADSWRKHGWHPVVIDHGLAKTHPYYQHFLKSYMDLPSVNSKEYELACYIRHVAMVQSGGGLLVDYDVINVGYSPDMLPVSNGKYPAILADKNPCPCGVYGNAEEYDALCSFFAKQGKEAIVSEGGRPHTSDQHFVQHFASHFRSYEHIWQYGQKGWQDARLIHFSSGSCQGRPRSEVIPSALDFLYEHVAKNNLPKPPYAAPISGFLEGVSRNGKSIPVPVRQNSHSWIGEVRELADRLKAMGDTPNKQAQISVEIRRRFHFRPSRNPGSAGNSSVHAKSSRPAKCLPRSRKG